VKVENSCEKSDFFDISEDLAGITPEVTFWSRFRFFWPFRARFDVSGDILTFLRIGHVLVISWVFLTCLLML